MNQWVGKVGMKDYTEATEVKGKDGVDDNKSGKTSDNVVSTEDKEEDDLSSEKSEERIMSGREP